MDFNKLSSNNEKSNLSNVEKLTDIDIYVKQRNGKKSITTIYGLGQDLESLKLYSKDLRKTIGCSCSVSTDDETDDQILKLSGKDTINVIKYLTTKLNIKKENITIHGD